MVEPVDVKFNENSDNCVLVCDCVECRKIVEFEAPISGYMEYFFEHNRRNIQYCFPNVPPEHREMLMSGICPECFDRMFKPEEEG